MFIYVILYSLVISTNNFIKYFWFNMIIFQFYCKGNPGLAGYGGFFVDCDLKFTKCFCCRSHGSNFCYRESCGKLLETSLAGNMLLLQAFKSPNMVPWSLNFIVYTFFIFKITHIYRKGNARADRIASFN